MMWKAKVLTGIVTLGIGLAFAQEEVASPRERPGLEVDRETLERLTRWLPDKVRGATKKEASADGRHLYITAPAGEQVALQLMCNPWQPDLDFTKHEWALSVGSPANPRTNVIADVRPLLVPGFDRGIWEIPLNVPPWPGGKLRGEFWCVNKTKPSIPVRLHFTLAITELGGGTCTHGSYTVVPNPQFPSDVQVGVHLGVLVWLDRESVPDHGFAAEISAQWFPGNQDRLALGPSWILVRLSESSELENGQQMETLFTHLDVALAIVSYQFPLRQIRLGVEAGVGLKYSSATTVQVEGTGTVGELNQSGGLGSALALGPVVALRFGAWEFPLRLRYLALGEQPDYLLATLGVTYLP